MTLPDLTKPVACTLTDAQTRERRALVRDTILANVTALDRVENGLTMTFANTATIHADLVHFIALEQGCCGFLDFDLTADRPGDASPKLLTITGAPDAAEAIDTLFRIVQDGSDVRNVA